jgi:DNA invertase Pin-like site-specific DNA recombinase
MRLDHIIRTSHRKQDAMSPDQQRQIAREFARRGGHKIVCTHDSGGNESGRTMDRAALHAVRERVRSNLTDGAFVSYLDRLGRAPIEESMTFVRGLVELDGGVLIAGDWNDEPIDLADDNVEDMLVFRMQMNRSMWNKAAKRQRINRRDALKAGKFIGPTPFGYAKQGGRLVLHPVWGDVAAEAFRRAARDGHDAARRYLTETAPDERIWRTDMVRKLLANRTYLGEHGKRGVEGYTPHPALVDPETFELAQQAPRARRGNGDYLLSGLVQCVCGGHLVGQRVTHHNRPERRYRCSNLDSTCNAAALDDLVRKEIREAVDRVEVRERVLPANVEELHAAVAEAVAERDAFVAATSALAGDYSKHLAKLDATAVATERMYLAARAQARAVEMLPAADELDNDDGLRRALRILAARGLALALAPQRYHRGPLGDRLVWIDDFKVVSGPLAA